MSSTVKLLLSVSCLLVRWLDAGTENGFQTAWAHDTIAVQNGDSVLTLSHGFLIEGSESVISEGKLVKGYHVESIRSRIVLPAGANYRQEYIVSYEYLTTPFPSRFGPPMATLPRLSAITDQDPPVADPPELASLQNELPLVADGTIFRGVSVSPLGGVSLNGGLRLSLQGQLSEDMTVAGTLSDQKSPIQPEGNTQTLDEIDKVYLEIKHPSGKIVAGDIDMNLKFGQFLSLSRRLEGLHVDLSRKGSTASAFVAGTKGKFQRMEIAGEDQNQGPYALFSEIGARNLIVMAGSERVWLDGERLARGENNDYTIDYSRGELTFTPERVIDANSRIYVEFEYSDLVYPREIASVAVKRVLGDGRSSAAVAWVREKDNRESELAFSVNDQERDRLEEAGDDQAKVPTAYQDSTGDYRRVPSPIDPGDSIFVYVPDGERIEGETYYRVSFQNVGTNGEYARQVTSEREVFFEYVDPAFRDGRWDLYVPWKTIKSPGYHQIVNVIGDFYLGDSTQLAVELAGSDQDRNLFSRLDDSDNAGAAGAAELSHVQRLSSNLGVLALRASIRHTGNTFSALQRDKRVEFNREWNLIQDRSSSLADRAVDETISKMEVRHRLGNRMSSIFSFGRLNDELQRASRWHGETSLSTAWVPQFQLDLTLVDRRAAGRQFEAERSAIVANHSTWSRSRLSAEMLPGRIHPFLRYESEERTSDFKFWEAAGGFLFAGQRFEANVGLTRRLDSDAGDGGSNWREKSNSWLGEIDMSGRWRSGHRLRLTFKQQIKSYSNAGDNISYSLARGSLGYNPARAVVKGNLDFKLEQSLFEEKIVVFDSVGSAAGNYRYDPNYDQYFLDPNGDYLAFYLPSGRKTPAAHLSTGFKLFVDFRTSGHRGLRDVKWKIYGNSDYNGRLLTLAKILNPTLSMVGVNRSKVNLQQQIDYLPKRSRRKVRVSTSHRGEVIKQNLQETYERKAWTYSGSLEEPLSHSMIWVTDASIQGNGVRSTVSARNRHVKGWHLSSGVRWKLSRLLETGGDLRFGRDRGANLYESFQAQMMGLGVHALLLPRKGGRIQSSLDYFSVSSKDALTTTLPPEAVQGLQLGNTFRVRLTAFFVIGESLTANANMSYIEDLFHDGLITLSGEVRASF